MSRYVIVVRFFDDHLPMQVHDGGDIKIKAEMKRRSIYMDAAKANRMPYKHVLTSVEEIQP